MQSCRICVRLRPDDQRLLRERARARGMPSSTNLSVLTRAHLRRLAPLPKAELLAHKRFSAELAAIGRNLNCVARHANAGAPNAERCEDLQILLFASQALRDHIKVLIRSNLRSWESGHAGRD